MRRGGAVQDGGIAGQEPGGGGFDQASTVAGEQERGGGGFGPDQGPRVGHGEDRQRRWRGLPRGQPQPQFAVERIADLGGRVGRAEGHRPAHPGRRGDQVVPQALWQGEVVALVLEVGLEQDLPGAHEPGDRGQDGRVERAFLDRLVEGLHQVGGSRCPRRYHLAGDVGPVEEPGATGSSVTPHE